MSYIEVTTDYQKILINVNTIRLIKKSLTHDGCNIFFDNSNYILTKESYEEIKQKIFVSDLNKVLSTSNIFKDKLQHGIMNCSSNEAKGIEENYNNEEFDTNHDSIKKGPGRPRKMV